MALYSEVVMDHFMNPRNVGTIENADGVGEVGKAKCGDIMKIYLKIENDTIVDVKFETFGCGSAIASSSIIHLRAGRLYAPLLLYLLFFGIPAAFGGRMLASLLPRTVLRLLLGFFLVLSGIFALTRQKKRTSHLTNKAKSAIIRGEKENTR